MLDSGFTTVEPLASQGFRELAGYRVVGHPYIGLSSRPELATVQSARDPGQSLQFKPKRIVLEAQ